MIYSREMVILIFSLILLLSCNKENKEEKEKVVITGKTPEYLGKELTLINTDSFKKNYTLDKNYSFSDTLTISEGFYQLYIGEHFAFPLYLEPKKNLSFNLNYKENISEIIFSGDGAKINDFLNIDCALLPNKEYNTHFNLKENDFIKSLDEKKKNLLKKIESSAYNQNIKLYAKNNIEFDYLTLLNRHFSVRTGKATKINEITSEFIKNIGLDNEKLFNNSSSYKDLVSDLFFNDILNNKLDETKSYAKHFDSIAIKEINTFKSTKIKDFLISNLLLGKISSQNTNYKKVYDGIKNLATNKHLKEVIEEKYQSLKKLAPGSLAPNFTFQDINGKLISLTDFKGKFVYIDVWGTWCNPCKTEIPYLKKLEEKFHNDNIEFLSISVFDKKEAWSNYVKKEKLKGVQLYQEKENPKFDISKLYKILSYPTFLLIDPDGKIISIHAMRPSNDGIIDYLNNYLKNKN